jgi:hypothetical protein
MTKKNVDDLHEIVKRSAEWPTQAREELQEAMLNVEDRYYRPYITTEDDREALKRSADDVRSNRFAPIADVEKVYHDFKRS